MPLRYLILIILTAAVSGAISFSYAGAQDFPQELYISSIGQARLLGAEVTTKHALNLFAVRIWGQKWMIVTDYVTKFESAASLPINPEEILAGHKLEIKGRPMFDKVGYIEASLVRDLSIGEMPQVPPASLPAAAALSLPAPAPPTPSISRSEVTPPTVLTQTLDLDMRGKEVTILQEFLQKNGWGIPDDGPVTGYFGKVTQKALINFQKAQGLEPVGSLGPKTRDLINSLLGKSPKAVAKSSPETTAPVSTKKLTQELNLGSKGQEVIILQEFLQKNGWGIPDDGPVTGYFGKVTMKALLNFQKAKGLAAVGIVGSQTRELINSLLAK